MSDRESTTPAGSEWREGFRGRWHRGDAPEDGDWAPWAPVAGRHRFPWLGIVLVLVGLGLLLRYVEPRIGFGNLFVLALGLAFAASWLVGRSRGAMLPTLVLVPFGAARILEDLRVLVGDGWSTLAIGVGLVAAWAIGRVQGGRHGWALWIGALLALVGLAQVSDRIPGFPALSAVWPLLIIGAGIVMIVRSSARSGPRPS